VNSTQGTRQRRTLSTDCRPGVDRPDGVLTAGTVRDLGETWFRALNALTACLDYIETNWTDLRPRSLVEFMNQAG
jgi:hypothetical protein